MIEKYIERRNKKKKLTALEIGVGGIMSCGFFGKVGTVAPVKFQKK